MRRRITLLGSLSVLAMSIVTLGVATHSPAPCPVEVRPETYGQLKVGMSEREIEAILRGPPGDYRTRKDVSYLFGGVFWPIDEPITTKEWDTDDYAIQVWFDRGGEAVFIVDGMGIHYPPTLSERYVDPLLSKLEPFIPSPWKSAGQSIATKRRITLCAVLIAVVSLGIALWALVPRKALARRAEPPGARESIAAKAPP